MFYRMVRSLLSMGLGSFYRVEVVRRVTDFSGPVMLVGNHPNSLIDPAMVFIITDRRITFLAREPLFRAPILGWILRSLGALPVYRKQDHPQLMEKNEGTLDAAANALKAEGAITIFPEGRSHSDPQLSDIKTGCARIALKVAQGGQALRIIPIGLTYAQKHRFRSKVHIEVGEPLLVQAATGLAGPSEHEWVRSLTASIDEALRAVTLNLETWEDLDLVQTADRLFALRNGYREQDADRLRLFARGASMLRAADPEAFHRLKEDVLSFHARLQVVKTDPANLTARYQFKQVSLFVLRNLLSITLGFPFFALGLVLFSIPFFILKALALAVPISIDRLATLKLVAAMLLVPLWWTLLTAGGWALGGPAGMVVMLVCTPPAALFTRYFVERRRAAFNDIVAFLKLGNRPRLRAHLLAEGERLQEEIQRVVVELKPKLEAELISNQ